MRETFFATLAESKDPPDVYRRLSLSEATNYITIQTVSQLEQFLAKKVVEGVKERLPAVKVNDR